MNTTGIYNAQLNVSKYFTTESISGLINNISNTIDNKECYYNTDTKSIDIEMTRRPSREDEINVNNTIRNWLETLPVEKEDIEILSKYVAFVFNITILTSSDKIIVKIYLY